MQLPTEVAGRRSMNLKQAPSLRDGGHRVRVRQAPIHCASAEAKDRSWNRQSPDRPKVRTLQRRSRTAQWSGSAGRETSPAAVLLPRDAGPEREQWNIEQVRLAGSRETGRGYLHQVHLCQELDLGAEEMAGVAGR